MTAAIVVGSDGSAPSRAALKWAVRRATELDRRIVLCHVRDDELSGLDQGELAPEVEILAALESEADAARTSMPDAPVDIECRVLDGSPVPTLADLARDAELLVIGTHKTGFVQGRAFASRLAGLVGAIDTPLAFIPDAGTSRRRGVVVGVEDEPSSERAIRWAATEADRLGEALVLVGSVTVPSRTKSPELFAPDLAAMRMGSLLERSVVLAVEAHPALGVKVRTLHGGAAADLVDAAATARLLVVAPSDLASRAELVSDVLLNLSSPTIVLPAR